MLHNVSQRANAMPISLRLKPELEARIAEYCERTGLSKSAVIMRGISEFLDAHATPSAYDLYLKHAPDVTMVLRSVPEVTKPAHERYRAHVKAKHARRTG